VIFIDTSAFYAILDRDDEAHVPARVTWIDLLSPDNPLELFTSNYVLVESFALIQARLGISAVQTFHDAILAVVKVHWIAKEDHFAATNTLLTAARRKLSLVDCTSFQLMRRLGANQAFVFDRHFSEQGFETLPS
jgi:predicted nucleic acid-binding protein